MNISDMPIQELLDDRAASLSDIKVCELALLQGITHYSGGSTRDRLDTNKKIVTVIEAELSRRAAEQINAAELPSSDECLCSVGNEDYHDPWCPAAKSAIR